ncbi:HepT-like ribonuclease domain-containing protein [Pseudanabaena sp. FACHB-2040]|uniref:HepT-like ribonuclease domain-containing protein n=1 Tax=Pseudanabaena sp. FACHB-2040 TaxID=2692859 RepID=UPI001F5580E5|nr:HepT-like ribonuclease domain-containing protein [Pseudanabaena sp. FACHB-2040]
MTQSIQRIQCFTSELTFDEYLNDIRTISAVERQFEVLGEAARRISNEFRQAHPAIDWQRIVGLRNIVAHRYD